MHIKNIPIMLCACCQKREANKKNTHYLTDGIIRSCLNLEGNAEREKGFYFDLSNKTHVNFNFQRGTDIEKLEAALGRPATEEEIEKAKQNPYSVDNIFCDQCENIFSEIETNFITTILPRFRNSNLSNEASLSVNDVKLVRLFFYIQLWRSSMCSSKFSISSAVLEVLRNCIVNRKIVTEQELTVFPLSVTYLQTLGDGEEVSDDEAYTQNIVGLMNLINPFIILMNDFVIQFFENESAIKFQQFYGINGQEYKNYINHGETTFKFRIVSNAGREVFLKEFWTQEARDRIQLYSDRFRKLWLQLFGSAPQSVLVGEYIAELTKHGLDILNYSQERITQLTVTFIQSKS
jgi:hypothetical protein